jgi:RNA polymerase sigma-70 factor (ECF subfamily)
MSGQQDDQINLADVQRGLNALPAAQREALILVGAGGFSYEEAAEICDVAIGTIKSRVARARTALEKLLDSGDKESLSDASQRGDSPLSDLMQDLDNLSEGQSVRQR